MSRISRRLPGIVVVLVTVLAGCASQKPSSVALSAMVEGVVTVNNKPLSGGCVTFLPLTGENPDLKPGIARIESDGSYWIGNANLSKPAGLHPGRYKVTVLQMTPGGGGIELSSPTQYADMQTTPLEFNVKAGKNRIRLDLVDSDASPEESASKVASEPEDERK